jgi:hypothetical protein
VVWLVGYPPPPPLVKESEFPPPLPPPGAYAGEGGTRGEGEVLFPCEGGSFFMLFSWFPNCFSIG